MSFDPNHAGTSNAQLYRTYNERRFQSFLFGSAVVSGLVPSIFAVAMASSLLSQTPGQDHGAPRQKIDVSKLGPQGEEDHAIQA
jgi:hypothetical protein